MDIVDLNLTMLRLENEAINVPQVVLKDKISGKTCATYEINLDSTQRIVVIEGEFL
jgi:hypothetical protein